MTEKNWAKLIVPVLEKYRGKKHPLEFENTYQLVVMIVLAAQSSDAHINKIAPDFFKKYPAFHDLAKGNPEDFFPFFRGVRNFANKARWLKAIAQQLNGDEKNLPGTMKELMALPGIGRKTANVILKETGRKPEGIAVDLHVMRVSPRLGIAAEGSPDKIEKQLMKNIDPADWGEAAMAISFLGREICRPTNPKCSECLMQSCCEYFERKSTQEEKPARAKKGAARKKQPTTPSPTTSLKKGDTPLRPKASKGKKGKAKKPSERKDSLQRGLS